ncbi:pyridoxal-phosphate-dependent aminotransferase family protein [Vannielia litorea]|uniref:Alanine-glyoxylate transaminase / serine-glyoxylate transaminase / serine-pyruvate transaminase n=1 Tax=Vannielia litorea TaxID=1217970 RepID=A0A1N6GA67_9RHOB|nr:aminotransferase class V-fold PLP-dependent enzyme [Vannielia litorea]SIO04394.1 alanine-glyoxylate transaminase / serine-glyoxylate transaminase / serine-pyruvate transaminase [Vannielia litorea]
MTLAHGREYLAIPGPSVMPDRVLQAMHRAAPNIYEGALADMVDAMIPDLKAVARTKHHAAIYICNGHGAWEAALTNVLSRGDRVLALCTGRFTHGWADVAVKLGAEVERLDFGNQGTVDHATFAEALAADKAHAIKAVLVAHVDTATSVRNDIKALRDILDKAGHPALLCVDCIASLACDTFEMDAWGVDVMISASQKGLMTPPGLGFVWFNDRADAAHARADMATLYWDWTPRSRPEFFYQYFGGTAPTHHLYGLREALTMIGEEGLENVWERHRRLAGAVWAAVAAWGQGGPLRFNVEDPALRTHAVTALSIGRENGKRLRNWLTENTGVTLGIGLGMYRRDDPEGDGFFRIGHMGHLNSHMVLGVLGSMEAGMTALGIDHGRGALEAAARACA